MRRKKTKDEDLQLQEYDSDIDDYSEHDYYDDSTVGLSIGQRFLGVLICLILLAGLVVGGIALYNWSLEPIDSSNSTPELITIDSGMTVSEISQLLEDSHLIRNGLVFQSYVGRHSYGGAEIQAATYELAQNMSVAEIYSKLINGEAYEGPLNNIVFPEGLNINEMANIVAESGMCTAEEYLAEASNIQKYKASFPILDSIPEEEIPERTLEGYLFPATYKIGEDTGVAAAESLISEQLSLFTENYSPELQQKTLEAGRTIDDVVILASIIELETLYEEDRPLVASVFYNRIAAGMPLQSDITIDYIYGTRTPVLTTEQTQVESPYNTYINLGLPLGPICSPGLSSIEAAVEPATTNYLYFVADMSTGKLYFNETLDEHNEDVTTYVN